MAKAYINGVEINKFVVDGGGSSGGGTVEGLDWSQIGYDETPSDIVEAYNYALDIKNNWDYSNTNYRRAFSGDTSVIYFPVLNNAKITNAEQMFQSSKLRFFSFEGLDTSELTNAKQMFMYSDVREINIGAADLSKVTEISNMCYGCYNLQDFDMTKFNSNIIREYDGLFYACSKLKSINFTGLNFNLTKTYNGFYGSFYEWLYNVSAKLIMDNVTTSEVTNYRGMFYGYKGNELDLSSFDMSSATIVDMMFDACSNLQKLKMNNFINSNAITSVSFSSAPKLGVNSADIPDARQALIDTFVYNSFDRVSAGYVSCTLNFSSTTKALFTDDEIAQMTSKGFTIA